MARRTSEPDPYRLVRESAGAYRTEDGRFTVRSAGGPGRWYVTDTGRHDQLGMELVIGPFEALDQVRPAITTQRDAPADAFPALPAVPSPAVEAGASKGRDRGHSAPGPEPPAPAPPEAEPVPEPEPAARPAARVQLARWRKRGDERDAVAAVLRRINAAWTSAQPEQMADELDPDVLFVQPGFEDRLEGRNAVIASYRAFMEGSIVHDYDQRDLQVDVRGATAVATFGFLIEWGSGGERHLDRGRDLFVFARSDGAWRAVWRTLIVRSEETAEP